MSAAISQELTDKLQRGGQSQCDQGIHTFTVGHYCSKRPCLSPHPNIDDLWLAVASFGTDNWLSCAPLDTNAETTALMY